MTDFERRLVREDEPEEEPMSTVIRERVPPTRPVPVSRLPVWGMVPVAVPAPEARPRPVPEVPTTTSPAETHARLLDAAVAGLRLDPAPAPEPVRALLVGYADASSREVERAARTLTEVFVRAPAGSRRALRDVISAVLVAVPPSALTVQLAVRLAGGAFPRSTPVRRAGETEP